jgi:hypothetical protein
VAYGPRPKPGTEGHAEASKKRKVDAYNKAANKCTKVPMMKKLGPLKIDVLRAKSDVKRPPHTEVAATKAMKRTKKIISDSQMTPVVG